MEYDGTYPHKMICEAWLKKIRLAAQKKRTEFGQYAEECAKFYNGPPDYMWAEERINSKDGGFLEKGTPLPKFRVQLNKLHEAVSLFGPSLFHQYPNVQVKPARRPEIHPLALGVDLSDPYVAEAYGQQEMQREADEAIRMSHANIAQEYLNGVQRVAKKKVHSRQAITSGIVRGLGLVYTKIHQPRGSNVRFPRSEFISECDYVKDSDASRNEDVQYIAVRGVAPKHILAEEHGIPVSALKGHFQSHEQQGRNGQGKRRGKKDAEQGKGDTFDLVEYWEVYSKNGFGDRLKDFTSKESGKSSVGDYSVFGPYCYLVLVEGVPFPLNLPPWVLESEESEDILDRVAWPIPFWTPPLNDWPVSELGFFFDDSSIWPIPLGKPLIGCIRFVNWCLSFLADKAAAAGTDYMAVTKKAAETIKQQLEDGVGPYKLLELPDAVGEDINKIVSILQAPNFHIGVWQMVSEVMELIDRQSGLNELLSGMTSTQMRSAEEASVRQTNTQIRPDDMAQCVEDWLTLVAKKEIVAAHWMLEAEDIALVVGDEAAAVWEQQMASQDFDSIITDFEYQIEAGSARKPNIANRLRSLNEFMASSGQLLQQLAMSGMPQPLNALMREWGKLNNLKVDEFLIPEPDPNAPQPPSEEERKAQQEQESHEAELIRKDEEHVQSMNQDEQLFLQDLRQDAMKASLDLSAIQEKNRASMNGSKA